MKTNVTEVGQWERELEVEVPAARIDKEIAKAFKDYQKRIELPGFRKGKVPHKLIEKRYGDSIRQGVISDLLPDLVQEAATAAGLVAAAPPKIAKLDHQPGQDLTFTAQLDVWPEIDVENYEKIKVEKPVHQVQDAEIDEQLLQLQNNHAAEQAVDHPLQRGEVLIADLQRLDEEGVAIIGERYEERYFLIGGDDAPSPEFEEALIGISPGEERKVRFSYRDDLPNEEMAGKQEHFAVTAREVRERTLPALDDEFAKDLGDRFQSLDDLKKDIAAQIRQRWDYITGQKVRADLIEGLIAANPFDLPPSLVENFLHSTQRQDKDHDHDHDHDHEYSDEERTSAERRLKGYLIVESLRKKLEVEVSDAEFDAYLAERAASMGVEAEALKRSQRADDLRREQLEDRLFKLLEEKADITEKAV